MKRLITLFAAVAFAGQAWAQDYDFVVDNLAYTITDAEKHEVSVGQTETALEGNLVIPAEVENEGVKYAVRTIDEWAFSGCRSLSSVTIPNSVTSIDESAFLGCVKLTEINVVSANKKYSSENGVLFDKAKTTLIRCPEGKTGTYIMPNSVTSIDDYAFYECYRLASISISDSVKTIGDFAFCGCDGLTSVTIPDSVTNIGYGAFDGCIGLISVTIGNSVTTIDDGAFASCYSLTTVTIPNSVTSIGINAFRNCSGLTSVTIGNSVTSIGSSAFYECGSLESVTIPDSVTSIGEYAFELCSSLTTVTIGNSVTSINYATFRSCSNLASVVIGNSVTTIGEEAFAYCGGLTSVTIPNSVTSIGDFAFCDCYSLISVTIPNSVTSISEYAFDCVKNIVYSGSAEGSPWGAVVVNGIFDGDFIYSDAEKTHLIVYIGEGGDVVIPNAVVSIGYAFCDCTNLKSVIIPNTVDTINANAFIGCTATIYCESDSKPDGWNSEWCGRKYKGNIVWGYKPTPVTESAVNAVGIYAYGNTIVVENATEEIRVYDAMGRLVCRDVACRVRTININGTGVYIVKVGNIAKRVVIN